MPSLNTYNNKKNRKVFCQSILEMLENYKIYFDILFLWWNNSLFVCHSNYLSQYMHLGNSLPGKVELQSAVKNIFVLVLNSTPVISL